MPQWRLLLLPNTPYIGDNLLWRKERQGENCSKHDVPMPRAARMPTDVIDSVEPFHLMHGMQREGSYEALSSTQNA